MKKKQILKKMRDDLEEIRYILGEMTDDECTCCCGCTDEDSDVNNASDDLVDIDGYLKECIDEIFDRNAYADRCKEAKKRMKRVIKVAYIINNDGKYALYYHLIERISTFVATIVRDNTEAELKRYHSGAQYDSLTLIHAWQLKTAITAALMNYAVVLQLNLSEIQLRNLNRENIKDVPEIRQMMSGFESVYRIFKNMINTINLSEGGIEQVLQIRTINTFTDTFIHVLYDILDVLRVAAHAEQKHFGIRYSFCMSQLKEANETIKQHLHYIFDAVDMNSDDIGSFFKEPPIEEDDDDDEVSDESEDGAEEYLDTDEENDDDDGELAVEEEDEEDDDVEDNDNDDSSDDDSENSEDSDGDIDEEKI